MRSLILLLVAVRYSCQSLTHTAANVTEIDVMLVKISNILSRCQADEMNYVGLCWSSETPEYWSAEFMRNTPAIRLKIFGALNSRSSFYNFPFYDKLHAFVLFVSSPSDLRHLIRKLAPSIWWNPLAFYAIIGDACDRPGAYLSAAWNLDLESCVFFCVESGGTHAAYTYNRHGNPAPRIWRAVEPPVGEERNLTWAMLRHELQSDTTCEELNFKKETKVGGYRIRLTGGLSPPTLTRNLQGGGADSYGGLDGIILSTLFDNMNATMSVTLLDKRAKIHLLLANVSRSEYDMLMNAQYIFNKPNYSMTYPHVESGISVLTRPSGFDSNETKIVKFMSWQLIAGILTVSVVTVLVLAALNGQTLSAACLEVTRIAINASVLRVPRGTPLRIYLITVFLLFLLTGSTFQSSLSSLLTSPTPRPDVDDDEALKDAGHAVYAFSGYRNAIADEALYARVTETDSWDCSEHVIARPDAACVADRNRLTRIAFESDLHVSKHRLTSLYMGYVTRPNFPLRKRIGRALMAMSEAGLIEHWRTRTTAVYKNKWRMKEQEMKRNKYRAMNVADLLFAFYLLLFGLGVSVLTFVSELVATSRSKSRNDGKVGKREFTGGNGDCK